MGKLVLSRRPKERVFICVDHTVITVTVYETSSGSARLVMEWEREPVNMSADEGLEAERQASRPGPEADALEEAKAFLLTALSAGPRLAKDVLEDWRVNHGGCQRTLYTAKAKLGVESFREKNPGPWFWKLPEGALRGPERRQDSTRRVAGGWTMHYAISVFHQDGEKRAKLTLVTPKYEFALVLPYGDLRTSEGRELIWAWAVGIFTIPASALPLELVDRVELVDRLFECLDQSYPVAKQ